MITTQLLLEGFGYLDLAEETSIPLNFDINDIRILGTRNGAWSKTIKIPGTNKNNEILGNVFNINLSTFDFDPLLKVKCREIVNGLTIFEGVFQLRKINQKFTSPTESSVSYDCTVKNDASSLFSELSGKLLTDLDISRYDHTYNESTVIDSFNSGNYLKGYQYFLGYNGFETDYWGRNFIPAIYAKTYLDTMLGEAGYSYEFPEADEIGFDTLITPFNGEYYAPSIDRKYLFKAGSTLDHTYFMLSYFGDGINPFSNYFAQWTFAPNYLPMNFPADNVPSLNFFDTSALYDETLTRYDVSGFSGTMDFHINLRGDIGITPSGGPVTDLEMRGYLRIRPNMKVQVKDANGVTLLTLIDRDILSDEDELIGDTGGVPIPVTNNIYNVLSDFNIETTAVYASALTPNAAYIEVNISMFVTLLGNFLGCWDGGNFYLNTFSMRVPASTGTNDNVLFNSASSEIAEGTTIYANTLIPREIKQSEYLLSLAEMFNLYIYQDVFNDKKIIIKTRDRFYADGVNADWSNKLDYTTIDVEFLSNSQKKIKKLTYAQDGEDVLLKAYLEQTRETYGQFRYVFANEHTRDTDTMETTFAPTPTIFANGLYLPYIDSQKPKNKIRILQVGNLVAGDWEYGKLLPIGGIITPDYTPYHTYRHTGMLYPTTEDPELDISFGTPQYFAYPVSTMTNANLYNRFYRNQLQILEGGKMLVGHFNLTAADIATLQFNERIYLLESWWNINRIIDYDATKRSLTKVELVSADSNLSPFLAGTFTINSASASQYYGKMAQTPYGKNDFGPGTSNVGIFGKDNLIHASSGNIIVIGDRNSVAGKNNLVVGNGNQVSGENVVLLGVDNLKVDENENGRIYLGTTIFVSNFISAGRDEVLNAFPDNKVINIVSAGRDEVRPLGGFTIENIISAGRDTV